jgi:hypothetical protein
MFACTDTQYVPGDSTAPALKVMVKVPDAFTYGWLKKVATAVPGNVAASV